MLVSWSWEWASCTIFSRAVVDLSHFMQQACRPWAPTCVGVANSSGQKFLHEQALAILNNRGKHDN